MRVCACVVSVHVCCVCYETQSGRVMRLCESRRSVDLKNLFRILQPPGSITTQKWMTQNGSIQKRSQSTAHGFLPFELDAQCEHRVLERTTSHVTRAQTCTFDFDHVMQQKNCSAHLKMSGFTPAFFGSPCSLDVFYPMAPPPFFKMSGFCPTRNFGQFWATLSQMSLNFQNFWAGFVATHSVHCLLCCNNKGRQTKWSVFFGENVAGRRRFHQKTRLINVQLVFCRCLVGVLVFRCSGVQVFRVFSVQDVLGCLGCSVWVFSVFWCVWGV